jgi:hypothetical protein
MSHLSKIFRRFWDHVCKQLNQDPAQIGCPYLDVEKNDRVVRVAKLG